jgi:hypothetical protein
LRIDQERRPNAVVLLVVSLFKEDSRTILYLTLRRLELINLMWGKMFPTDRTENILSNKKIGVDSQPRLGTRERPNRSGIIWKNPTTSNASRVELSWSVACWTVRCPYTFDVTA